MKHALHWLIDYWYIPAFIGGAVLLWVLTGGRRALPVATIKRELDAIRAGSAARKKQLLLGKDRAAEEVREEHAKAIVQLKAKQAAKAEEMRDDPVALSRFLIRVGRPDA